MKYSKIILIIILLNLMALGSLFILASTYIYVCVYVNNLQIKQRDLSFIVQKLSNYLNLL